MDGPLTDDSRRRPSATPDHQESEPPDPRTPSASDSPAATATDHPAPGTTNPSTTRSTDHRTPRTPDPQAPGTANARMSARPLPSDPHPRPRPHARTGVAEADLVLRAGHTLRRRLGEAMAGEDLSPHESRALRVIARFDGHDDAPAPRLSDIATALRIAPRSATEVVDRLQAGGLVTREPSPTDRRANLVRLTPRGADVLGRVETAWTQAARDFLSPLSPAEVDQLTALLLRLVEPGAGGEAGSPPTG